MVEKRPYPGDGAAQIDLKRPKPATTNGAGKTDMGDAVARARARAAAIAAKLKPGSATQSPSPAPASPAPPAQNGANTTSTQDRLAAMKARMAALNKGSPAPKPVSQPPPPPPPPEVEEPPKQRGGLGIGIHPALLDDFNQDGGSKGKTALGPKFGTTIGNRRSTESPAPKRQLEIARPNVDELKKNPYYDPSLAQTAGVRERRARQLHFVQAGKYIEQGAKLRQQAKLEQLKKEIAERARKAGLDENNEKGFIVPQPPENEWWDEWTLDWTEESDLMQLVQHPVILSAPQEKLFVPLKPMYLTPKEQKKVRRMRRAAEHKEEQAKIRLGLVPKPEPKVKRGNMMRVMGEQAITDPTRVEQFVENQIRERAEKHERENDERKLTKDQKHEKLANNQRMDADKGLQICVFKINTLAYGKHRYQIDVNAKQQALTGLTIINPKMNLVVVEGGAHSINAYKKLMLHRIKWTDNAAPSAARAEKEREPEPQWLQPVEANGDVKDMSFNKCTLVFEGEVKQRSFRKWTSKVCETESEAKDTLTRSKLDSFWVQAKNMP